MLAGAMRGLCLAVDSAGSSMPSRFPVFAASFAVALLLCALMAASPSESGPVRIAVLGFLVLVLVGVVLLVVLWDEGTWVGTTTILASRVFVSYFCWLVLMREACDSQVSPVVAFSALFLPPKPCHGFLATSSRRWLSTVVSPCRR